MRLTSKIYKISDSHLKVKQNLPKDQVGQFNPIVHTWEQGEKYYNKSKKEIKEKTWS